jgi:hypothetical protein
MAMNYPLLIASVCPFSLVLPLERGAIPPSPFCGVRLLRIMADEGAWCRLNRRFGRAVYAVPALLLVLSFFGHRVSMLFPDLDEAFYALDNHIALLAFLVGACVAVFAPTRSGGGGR